MYTEDTIIDSITILLDGQIQIRESNRVLKDGLIIANQYHRYVLDPGNSDDIKKSNDPRIISIIFAIWTPEIISARKEIMDLTSIINTIKGEIPSNEVVN